MTTEMKNQSLGEYIKKRRLSRKTLTARCSRCLRLHFSYWSKLEAGLYESPAPKHLQAIARALMSISRTLTTWPAMKRRNGCQASSHTCAPI